MLKDAPPPQKKTSFSLCLRMLYVRPIQIFSPSTWPIGLLRGSSNGEGSTQHKPFSDTNFPQYSLQHKQIKPLELGTLYTRSQGPENFRRNFGHCWVANWPPVINKCQNIDVRILINAGTLAPRVANWPPKFDGILFPALGPIQDHKVQHLFVLGADWKVFFYFSLDSQCKAHGADFNFCINRSAGFGVNIGPDSQCKAGLIWYILLSYG